MEITKANAIMAKYGDLIPQDKTIQLKNVLNNANDNVYDLALCVETKNPVTTLILAIFLGGLGIDRFYIGDVGLGVAKIFVGPLTLGIWAFVDIFCSYRKAKEKILLSLCLFYKYKIS